MSVDFPGALDNWTDVINDITTVEADHVNDARNQIIEIEKMLNLLHSTLSEWKVESDYLTGLRADYKSTTEIDISAGIVNISGTLANITGTTTLVMPTDLRSGESEQTNDVYNIYAHLSGAYPILKLSNIDPGSDLMHPSETGWRYCSSIPNISGDIANCKAYSDCINYPGTTIYGAAPSGAIQSIDLSALVPSRTYAVEVIVVNVADGGGNMQVQLFSENSATRLNSEMKITGVASGVVMTNTLRSNITDNTLYFKAASGVWVGIYLVKVYYNRRLF